jgi:hypothetical protein
MFLKFFFSLLLFSKILIGQKNDSVYQKKHDYAKKNTIDKPLKAAFMSTFLPGAGQFYNKKYWKLPIIYIALSGSIYAIYYNNLMFKKFDQAYIIRSDTSRSAEWNLPENFPEYQNKETLLFLANYHRRWRDFSAILCTAFYLMNIIDAYVDAHLKDFDVSEQLSLRVKPEIKILFNQFFLPNLSFTLKFNEKKNFSSYQ